MRTSELAVYLLAVVLGLSAGFLEIRLGDLLVTALFVLFSTMLLGFLRPAHAWRWILVVGGFVPLLLLAAYLVRGQRAYPAEVWESFLGLVTGTAGAYAGGLARKGVDELFRSR
jgi:lysylphosphatidylglycerol synthetase-like protein (DUF2156 family)